MRGLSFGLIHPHTGPFTGGHPDRVRAARGRWRTPVNAMQHCWKACWGQPLRSSNLLSSAMLTCKNTQDERRQDCLDVEICLSFVSVPGHETLRRPQGGAPTGSAQPFRLVTDIPDRPRRRAHARESCARIAAGPRQSRSACSGTSLPKDAGPRRFFRLGDHFCPAGAGCRRCCQPPGLV